MRILTFSLGAAVGFVVGALAGRQSALEELTRPLIVNRSGSRDWARTSESHDASTRLDDGSTESSR